MRIVKVEPDKVNEDTIVWVSISESSSPHFTNRYTFLEDEFREIILAGLKYFEKKGIRL